MWYIMHVNFKRVYFKNFIDVTLDDRNKIKLEFTPICPQKDDSAKVHK